jgi:hypothetical protein
MAESYSLTLDLSGVPANEEAGTANLVNSTNLEDDKC